MRKRINILLGTLFSYGEDPAKSVWRKSWSASRHFVRLKGMRDTLLWKLGWAPQTVQITLLSSNGKYPAHDLSKDENALVCFFEEYLLGWLNWCPIVSMRFWLRWVSFPRFALLWWKPQYLFHHYVSLWADWKQACGTVLVWSSGQRSLEYGLLFQMRLV